MLGWKICCSAMNLRRRTAPSTSLMAGAGDRPCVVRNGARCEAQQESLNNFLVQIWQLLCLLQAFCVLMDCSKARARISASRGAPVAIISGSPHSVGRLLKNTGSPSQGWQSKKNQKKRTRADPS